MKNCKILLFWLIILSLPLAAQMPKLAKQPQSARKAELPRGAITVRVMADDGQPLDDVEVWLSPAFADPSLNAYLPPEKPTRQKDNSYRFENVRTGLYRISASAPGYVALTNETADAQPMYYRVGETAQITLTRGGVITGTVTDADGTPMIEARVRAVRIRNQQNQRIRQTPANGDFAFSNSEFSTDDRGVYRIFGLLPGAYLIVVGGKERNFYFAGRVDPTSGAPTYHPSDPIDTATEIAVNYGQEMSGINVRYRNDGGQTISGVISGAIKTNNQYGDGINISLVRRGSGLIEATEYAREKNGKFAFKIEQIPSGEYELQASQSSDKGREVASKPTNLKITDADITGLEISLQPLASLAGKVIFARDPTLKNKSECQKKLAFSPPEIELRLHRDVAKPDAPETDSDSFSQNVGRAPDENGDFAFQGMETGKYRLIWKLPSDNYFARALASADGKTNFGKDGLNLDAGSNLSGLVLTVSDGAASLSGKVEFADKDRSSFKETANKFTVYLVPTDKTDEKRAADDLLRYAETVTKTDGSFELKNLAPGAYFLFAQLFVEDKEKFLEFRRPLSWNTAKLGELRRAAREKNNLVELAPCQNIVIQTINVERLK